MPTAHQIAQLRDIAKAPLRMENSPTNPLRPGMPMELSAVKKKTMVRTGMARIRPPYSGDFAGMAPLIDHADDQEEHAGGDAVVDLLEHEPAIPAVFSAKIPSVQKPRWLTEE